MISSIRRNPSDPHFFGMDRSNALYCNKSVSDLLKRQSLTVSL